MVDLPLPEGPTRKTNSPSLTSIVTPRSACVPFSYSFCTSVKRIIAVEGQTVDIDFTAGAVYVDGQLLEEDYIRQPTYLEEGLEFPVTVPEGCVFVMGDNRNDSDDSRDPELGPVDTRQILGRAVFLLFPGVTADTDKRDFGRIGPLT